VGQLEERGLRAKAKELILYYQKEAQAAFLTTLDPKGFPHTRAMMNLRNERAFPTAKALFEGHEEDFVTYFSTVKGLEKLKHLSLNPKASVFYCHPAEWWSLLIKGTLETIDAEEVRKRISVQEWRGFFPEGLLSSEPVVLRLNPLSAVGLCHIDGARYIFEFLG
jgi:general stress protein 26